MVSPARALSWSIPAAFLVAMLGVPLATIATQALGGPDGLGPLWRVLGDPYFQAVAAFSARQAAYSALASVVLGVFWAWVLVRYAFPFKRTLLSLSVVPFVLPAVSLALGFVVAFGRQGIVNTALMGLFGLEEPPLRLLYSLPAIVLAHAFYNAPIVARLTHAAWSRVDPSYEEGARALGAGPLRAFATVALPLVLPGVLAGAALAFIYSFLSFPIVLTLGGARFATLEVAIYIETLTLHRLDTGAALALVQVVLSLAFTWGYLWLERRFSRPLETQRTRPTLPLLEVWRPGRALVLAALLPLAGFFLLPFAGVLLDALRAPDGGWTFEHFAQVFAPDPNAFIGSSPLEAVANSARFALGALALALALGGPLAWSLARGRRPWLGTLAMLPLAISSVAIGFGLLRAFSQPPLAGVPRGAAVVAAHALLAVPFVVRALLPALRALDPSMAEAARSLGAPPWRVLREVTLPLLRPALLAAAAFAFAISLGEMSATLMLAAPGVKTMPVAVYSFLGARMFGAASAMSVVMIAAAAAAFVAIERAGARVVR